METSARNNGPERGFYALIVAGGSGQRMGGDSAIPKQYMDLGGKAVIRYAVDAFLATPGLKDIRVVINPAHRDLYDRAMIGLDLPAPIEGGKERKSSVYNGLKSFIKVNNDDKVLIHDAARPFININEINDLIKVLDQQEACTLASPVSDTLMRSDNEYVSRDDLWAVQTPQGFHFGVIKKAHEQDIPATDDTNLVQKLGFHVKLIEGKRDNFKITTPSDMELARRIVANRTPMTKTGLGYDVHAFDTSKKTGIIRLGGIDIPHDFKLLGHSDADVGLHAITDAILGALAAGDIGQHFPPSDPQWKNADSAKFLSHAVDMVHKRGGTISHLDLTFICEAPKVGLHREAMQRRIADICGIKPDQVGIKATTSEGLGFTGRGEGIAAHAIATIEVPRG